MVFKEERIRIGTKGILVGTWKDKFSYDVSIPVSFLDIAEIILSHYNLPTTIDSDGSNKPTTPSDSGLKVMLNQIWLIWYLEEARIHKLSH